MVFAAESDYPFTYIAEWVNSAPDKSANFNSVGDFLGVGLNVVFGTAIAVSTISLILSGIKFITAKGDPKAAATAKTALTNAVLAFILSIGAYTIKAILFNVMGGDFGSLRNATPNF